MTKPPLTRDPAEVLESLRRTLEAKKEATPPETPQNAPEQSAAVNQLSRIADSSPSLKEAMPKKENYKLTRAQNKLLDASVAIFAEPATTKDAAFIARELVQTSLPHKNPGNIPVWKRTNGNLTFAIQPGMSIKTGKSYGLPLRQPPTSPAVLDDYRSHTHQKPPS